MSLPLNDGDILHDSSDDDRPYGVVVEYNKRTRVYWYRTLGDLHIGAEDSKEFDDHLIRFRMMEGLIKVSPWVKSPLYKKLNRFKDD